MCGFNVPYIYCQGKKNTLDLYVYIVNHNHDQDSSAHPCDASMEI